MSYGHRDRVEECSDIASKSLEELGSAYRSWFRATEVCYARYFDHDLLIERMGAENKEGGVAI